VADRLTKGMSSNGELRFLTADIANTAEEGKKIHKLSPVKSVIFAKFLAAGLLFGYDLKEDNYLVTLKVEGSNPKNYLIVTANNKGKVKGYPHMTFEDKINTTDFSDPVSMNKKIREEMKKVLQHGLLNVVRDVGMKAPYNGSTKLITGEIARDITYYLTVSEQIPSIVGVSVILNHDSSIKNAVGFIVQLMPEATEETINHLESNMQKLPEIIDLLEMGMTIEEIMRKMILKGIEHKTTKELRTEYYCDCSRERFEKGLMLLNKDELAEIIGEGETVPVKCHYCNKTYEYDAEKLEKILKAHGKKDK